MAGLLAFSMMTSINLLKLAVSAGYGVSRIVDRINGARPFVGIRPFSLPLLAVHLAGQQHGHLSLLHRTAKCEVMKADNQKALRRVQLRPATAGHTAHLGKPLPNHARFYPLAKTLILLRPPGVFSFEPVDFQFGPWVGVLGDHC